MMFRYLLIGILMIATTSLAQDDIKRNLYYGNQAYVEGDFEEALGYYQEAVNQSPLNYKANYNLANTYLRLNKQEKAIERYNTIANLAPSSYDKATVYHNLGNANLMNQDLEGAIKAYKEALRLNPSDEQTRYNLAYCLQQKQKQQKQQQQNQNESQKDSGENEEQQNQDQQNGQDGDQQQNQDENQNGNENESQKDSGENGDQQNQGGDDQQDKQDGQQQSQSGNEGDPKGEKKQGEGQKYGSKLSKEQIENILNSYYKREKELQKKLNKKKQVKNGSAGKKDW